MYPPYYTAYNRCFPDPVEGEWGVDVIVVDGTVEYVALRIRPELLTSFIDCLVEDVPETWARDGLAAVAKRHGIEELSTEAVDTDVAAAGESDAAAASESDTAADVEPAPAESVGDAVE